MGYRTAWTNSTITSGTINVSIAPAAGEFLIAWAITDANDTLKSYSAGWTSLASLRSTADNADLFVLYKIADGSETTVSFTTNSGNSMIAGCAAFSGIDTTTPLDVAPVSFANSASSTTSDISITPVTNGAVLARVQCCDNGSTDATFTFSTTAGTTGAWTTRVDQHASYYDVALGTAEQTTAGAITNRCTTSVSGGRIGWLFALRPAASGTTYNDTVSEGVTLGESPASALTAATALSEGVTLGDSQAATRVTTDALGEGPTLGDSFSAGLLYTDSLSEGATFGADYAAVAVLATGLSEGLILNASYATAQTFVEALSEGVTLGDGLAPGLVLAATLAEAVTFGDAFTSAVTKDNALAESVTLGDSFAAALSASGTVSEGQTLGADLFAAATYPAVLSEGVILGVVLVDEHIQDRVYNNATEEALTLDASFSTTFVAGATLAEGITLDASFYTPPLGQSVRSGGGGGGRAWGWELDREVEEEMGVLLEGPPLTPATIEAVARRLDAPAESRIIGLKQPPVPAISFDAAMVRRRRIRRRLLLLL